MIKNKFLLILSPLLISSCIGATPLIGVQNAEVSPLYLLDYDTSIKFSVNASTRLAVTVNINLINDLYPSGIEIFNKTYKANTTESFVYDNSYTRPGNNIIKFSWKCPSNRSEASFEHKIPVVQNQTIKINDSIYTYTSKSAIYNYSSGGSWTSKKEKITFTNFESIYMPDYYHKIDISTFRIKIDNINPLYKDATFSITNRDGVFNCFEHDKTYSYIPLKLVATGNEYYLAFGSSLFVDQTTLEMSLTKKKGYVKTNYLYLPRNEKRFESEYECTIRINELGLDRNDYLTKFNYKSVRNIIGDCHNSEYCIMNGK